MNCGPRHDLLINDSPRFPHPTNRWRMDCAVYQRLKVSVLPQLVGTENDMTLLGEHFERVRQSLLAKSKEIGIAKHGTSKGTARELLVSDFFAANLPRHFDYVTGEIMAPKTEDRSGQIDILILPHSAPSSSGF